MRVVMLLTAVAALWVQPAAAVTTSTILFEATADSFDPTELYLSTGPFSDGHYTFELTSTAATAAELEFGGQSFYRVTDDEGTLYDYNNGGFPGAYAASADLPLSISADFVNMRTTKIPGTQVSVSVGGLTVDPNALYNFEERFEPFLRATLFWSIEGPATVRLSQYFTPFAVPEPGTWLMMILGLGVTGAALRRQATSLGLSRPMSFLSSTV